MGKEAVETKQTILLSWSRFQSVMRVDHHETSNVLVLADNPARRA